MGKLTFVLEQANLFQRVLLMMKILIHLKQLAGMRNPFKLVTIRKVQVRWQPCLLFSLLLFVFFSAVSRGKFGLASMLFCHDEKWREIPP